MGTDKVVGEEDLCWGSIWAETHGKKLHDYLEAECYSREYVQAMWQEQVLCG